MNNGCGWFISEHESARPSRLLGSALLFTAGHDKDSSARHQLSFHSRITQIMFTGIVEIIGGWCLWSASRLQSLIPF